MNLWLILNKNTKTKSVFKKKFPNNIGTFIIPHQLQLTDFIKKIEIHVQRRQTTT